MIELIDINKTYRSKRGAFSALQNIHLSVETGEIFGVIGKSGAGKSTLIRCVNLLEKPTSGQIKVHGELLTSLSTEKLRQARQQIGMVFQHFNLLTSRTVYDNIALPLEFHQYSKKEIQQRITPLLELTGLTAYQNAYPSQLSGGQKQRVAIARALATQPRVLLCDEMTSSLDPQTTASILDLIENIHAQMHLTILLITHEMEVIKRIADKVAVMDQGRIVELNSVVNIFRQPQSAIAKSFTSALLKGDLPPNLEQFLQKEPGDGRQALVRITFVGPVATQPIIYQLMKQTKVTVNILQANLELLHHETMGVMVVALQGQFIDIQAALAYLTEQQVTHEVLGYVAEHALANH